MFPNSTTSFDISLLGLFGTEDSIALDSLIEHLTLLRDINPYRQIGPVFDDNASKFSILEQGQPVDVVYKSFFQYLGRCVNWKSPRVQLNTTPPVLVSSVAASAVINLVNPNLVWDLASGRLGELELEMIDWFGRLIGWESVAGGVFTFGGTGTNMYGIKVGMTKAIPNSRKAGCQGNFVVLSTDQGHSCHVSLCSWLGIGSNNCLRLPTESSGTVDARNVVEAAEDVIKRGQQIAAVILNGGTNFSWEIDPIEEVATMLVVLQRRHCLQYKPHLHIDSVIGWVFLLFTQYDFDRNPLGLSEVVARKLGNARDRITAIKYADSCGVDFHKTGFVPYASSLFMLRNAADWGHLTGDAATAFKHQSFNAGAYKPGTYTLETSRSAHGVVAASVALAVLGVEGMQRLVAQLLTVAEDFRDRLGKVNWLHCCNPQALGWATLFGISDDDVTDFNLIVKSTDPSPIERWNRTQREFHSFISATTNPDWIVGHTNNCVRGAAGISIGALKVYPMSPFITIQHNGQLLAWLRQCWDAFLVNKASKQPIG